MMDAEPTGPGPEGRDALEPGTTFAGHRIEQVIGGGGMGVVYRARHLTLDRERALKVVAPELSADQRFRERFKRESRLAAQVEHPNVIPVHHAGEESGQLYLTMRLVDGVDLRSLVQGSGPLGPAHAVRVLAGIAAGLDAAHAKGLVHRDVKPANVLVEGDDGAERIFLTDFGISRLAGSEETLTTTGEFFGSLDYVAPEQIEGETVDARTDVYALGGVLHFLLTAKPPFPRDTELAKLFAHANASPPRPSQAVPGLPPAIDDVVAKAMAKRPEERYESAGELAAEAADALGEPAPALAPPAALRTPATAPRGEAAPTRKLQRPAPRRVSLAIAALAAVIAGAGAAILILSGDGASDSQAPAGPQPRKVATIDVARGPTGLTVGSTIVWVTSADARLVEAISPARNRTTGPPIRIDGKPVSVAVGFGSIWVVDQSADMVVRLDPAARPTPIPVGDQPTDVAVDDRWVWVTNGGEDTVSRVDPETYEVENVQADASPRSVATGEGAVWVANIDAKSVSEIDPRQAITVGLPIPVGQRPNDLAVGYGSVWVIDNIRGTLTPIDPDTHVVGEPISVGSHPRGVTTGFGYVWVANGGDDTVSRIDPEAAAPAGPPTRVGNNPADIAVGKGAVWTANVDSSTVTKIRP